MCFNTNIMFLDIIHRPDFIWNQRPVYFSKHNVSETGFCVCLQIKPTQLGPIDRASPCFVQFFSLLSLFEK
jgi:hypothetical protein